MEVIKQGEYHSDWSLDVTCDGNGWEQTNDACYSTLRIHNNDIKKKGYIII